MCYTKDGNQEVEKMTEERDWHRLKLANVGQKKRVKLIVRLGLLCPVKGETPKGKSLSRTYM